MIEKVLALLGSPHSRGVTQMLLAHFLAQAGENTDITRFSPWETPVAPCDGCGVCFSRPGCVKPDNHLLFQQLEQADALVIATPVYLLSFPAPLKAVFDRFQQYYGARFGRGLRPAIAKHKRAFLLITCGSEKDDGAEIILRQARMAFSVMNTAIEGNYILSGTDHLEEARLSREREALAEQARCFFNS